MDFDWITWSIWFVGFVVLVIWTVIPLREFRRLLERRTRATPQPPSDAHTPDGGADGRR